MSDTGHGRLIDFDKIQYLALSEISNSTLSERRLHELESKDRTIPFTGTW